jgi:hypothetical protein
VPLIRANTVLPASRERVTLLTADGLRLHGELALPERAKPRATLVTLHPLPTAGGSMESHLLRKMAWRLPALADLAVLRFDTRGTGNSEGSFGDGEAEWLDVAGALDFAELRGLPRLWLVGWSFGTDLALRFGREPGVEGAVLLSPPLRSATDADLDAWALDGRPLVAVVPEFDDYLRPAQAVTRFARVPNARVVAVPAAKHLFVGHAEAALDEVVRPVLPDRVPLSRHWPPGGA